MAETCLLVGLGRIGMEYDMTLDPGEYIYTHARAFSLHPAFDLAGAVDSDARKRALFEKTFSRSTYENLAQALKDLSPAVVIVANPTDRHRDTIERILERSSPKAILCEKPMGSRLEDAMEMNGLCEESGVKLYVNYMRRSDPGVIEVKQRLEDGRIKEPVRGIVWYSKGFIHNGSHFFNLIEYWLGAFEHAKIIEKGRFWDNHDPEPLVQLQFAKGTVTFVPAWEECFTHCTVELVSQNGRLYYAHGGESISWETAEPDLNLSGYTTLARNPEYIHSGRKKAMWHVADQLAAALCGKSVSLCTGCQAAGTRQNIYRFLEQ